MSIMKEIAKASRWQEKIFDEKLIIEGRILSPSEAEAAGLTSALIASTMTTPDNLKKLQEINAKEDNEDFDDLLAFTKNIRPEKLLELSSANDRIICSCVRRFSVDDGKTWDEMKLVFHEKDQNGEINHLWIGMLDDDDRAKILEACLKGHKKATERIRGLV